MKKLIILALLVIPSIFTGCKDDFAEQNTNPSVVVNPDVKYLFTQMLYTGDVLDYTQWFYNSANYTLPWTQSTVNTGGNTSLLNIMGAYNGQQNIVIKAKVYREEIVHAISTYSESDAKSYENVRVMCNPFMVYLGLYGTDMYGSMAYSEAAKVFHTNPPILTPKYDTQKELFESWLAELNETISVLGQNLPNQVNLGAQDFIYKGDRVKWLKLANSLKLKIAVRLLHVDKARALQIASEVANSSAGILSSVDDDMIWSLGSLEYHFGNAISFGYGREELMKFLVNNRDPRVRFLFTKNDFNSKVVQAFLDYKAENPSSTVRIPKYINDVLETEVVGGKTVFKAWKSPGEPWVRYMGAPANVYKKENAEINDDYFNSNSFKLGTRTYQPLSLYQEELTRGQKSLTYPDAPGVTASKDDQSQQWFGLLFSAAEVNLYLAEFALLGASLPNSADYYFEQGVRLSVQSLDNIAGLNKIPYYGKIYDPNESVIDLQPGEIDNLLTSSAYQLTGSDAEKLEKVYLQQYIHLLHIPNEQFVTVRRSGIPKRNSTILAWETFTTGNDANFQIPRRFDITEPLITDMMHDIKKAAFAAQGFSLGKSNEPQTLNTERIWYDKGAPNFGEGPNF